MKEMKEMKEWKSEIMEGLKEGQFYIVYQGKWSLENEKVESYEALLRWNHPVQGSISPGTFIPAAEQEGGIVPLTNFVLGQVCRDIQSNPIIATARIAINVSPTILEEPGLLTVMVRSHIEDAMVPYDQLELEITEQAPLIEKSQDEFIVLRKKGVTLTMDDYGIGYSSLKHLSRFPVQWLKIDQGLIQDIEDGRKTREILRSTVQMAKNLDMKVVGEGGETQEQFQFLKEAACEEIQGFFIHRPAIIKELDQGALMKTQRS